MAKDAGTTVKRGAREAGITHAAAAAKRGITEAAQQTAATGKQFYQSTQDGTLGEKTGQKAQETSQMLNQIGQSLFAKVQSFSFGGSQENE